MQTSFRSTWPWRSVGTAALTVALILGCGDSDDEEETWEALPREEPTLSEPTPRFQRVRLGETAAAEWTVRWPNGEKPRHMALDINQNAPPLDSSHHERSGWVEGRSVFRVEQELAKRGPHLLRLRPYSVANTTTIPVDASWALVQVMGGDADVVVPPLPETELAVGERRPMSGLPATALETYAANPNDNFGERFWSDQPLDFRIDDPTIASVTSDGVVEGLQEGQTTLRITAGSAEAEVTLHITSTPLGPPPDGDLTIALHGVETYRPETQTGEGPMETKVALDANGWPSILIQMRPGWTTTQGQPWISQLPPMALLRWTGTGFGLEWIGEPGDRYDHGLIDISDDGQVNLLLHDTLFQTLEIWSRPANATRGDWTITEVPKGPELHTGEVDTSWWAQGWFEGAENTATTSLDAAAVLPSSSGGTWFAYTTTSTFIHRNAEPPWSQQCPRMIRVAHVQDGAVEVELVDQTWLLTVQTTGGCSQVAGTLTRMLLLPPPFGATRPTILGLQDRQTRADDGAWTLLYRWRHVNDAWAVEPVDSAPDGEWARNPLGLVPIVPVTDSQDWFVENESKANLTWAWKDPGDGLVYTNQAPALGEFSGPGYAGHLVSSEKLYLFEDRHNGGFDHEFWLHTETLPSQLDD